MEAITAIGLFGGIGLSLYTMYWLTRRLIDPKSAKHDIDPEYQRWVEYEGARVAVRIPPEYRK